MKIIGNCYTLEKDGFYCPHLRSPMFHSGFTSKSGPVTWWLCDKKKKYIREIKKCNIMKRGLE